MNLHDYQPLALRTEKPLPRPIDRLMHAAIGIDTETGEINSIIKRVALYGKGLTDICDKEKGLTFLQCAGEEIADVCWYMAIGCDALSMNIGELAPAYHGDVYPFDELALQLATYSGKFGDIVLYAKKRGHAILNPSDRNYTLNTLANLVRVLNSTCVSFGLDLGTLLDANIAKLKKRYADKYSDEAAEARADKGGLDARNS